MTNKDTIYVLQHVKNSIEQPVVYAGRSARKACEVASKHEAVKITLWEPTKEQNHEQH